MTREKNTLRLLAGEKLYGGWTNMQVDTSIETISGAFDLEYTDRWRSGSEPWPINDGDACQVLMGDDLVLTGWVDEQESSLDATSSSMRVSGRDKTADLVDCSAIHTPDQWMNQGLPAIASALCKPFGIKVRSETDTGPVFPIVKIQPGETAFAVIERLCRMRAILPVSDGKGGLVLTSAGKGGRAFSALVEGVNILATSVMRSQEGRYSEYIVKGQQSGLSAMGGGSVEVISASGDVATRSAAPSAGRATDRGVTRYRPLLVIAETEASGNTPATRAFWEATVRAGRGLVVSVTVQGWRQGNGDLWKPNTFVHVRSERLRIDDTLLIVSCSYSCGESGTLTNLSLARPDAYRLLPDRTKETGLPPGTEIIGGSA